MLLIPSELILVFHFGAHSPLRVSFGSHRRFGTFFFNFICDMLCVRCVYLWHSLFSMQFLLCSVFLIIWKFIFTHTRFKKRTEIGIDKSKCHDESEWARWKPIKEREIHEVNWLVPADMFTNVFRKFEHKKHAVRLLSRRQQHRRELRRELDSPSQIIIARAAQAQRHHT